MKLYLFFMIFLVVGNASGFSLDFSFSDSEYSNGETVQVEIIVDGVLEEELKNDDLSLSCSGVFVPNLLKIDDSNYYAFFNLIGNEIGDCILSFNEIIYYEDGFLKQMDFETNFSIVDRNISTIFVDPAGIVFSDFNSQNFISLSLFNSNEDLISVSISPDFGFVEVEEMINISSSEFVEVDLYFSEFAYNNEEFGKILLKFEENIFEIPVWIDVAPVDIVVPIEDNFSSVVEPKIDVLQGLEGFNLVISKFEDKSGYVLLQNSGADIDLVEFKLSGDIIDIVDLQNENLKDFNSGDKFREYIYVNQKKTAEFGNYTGSLEIHYESEVIKLPILIKIEEVEINQTFINETVLPGTEKEENGINVWLLVLLFVILAGAILFLSYKKKTKKSADFLKHV